ncbi:MAG: choloylglycine hydrolase, partial [Gracilibacteraceae bacterium]|nr:choloylglycine hydrolase [Gracilibacteraceae bacterium]
RYDTVKEALDHNGGRFSVTQAVDILAEVGIIDRNEDILQWSVVYNLSARNGVMFAHRKINNLIDFQLAL